MTMTSRWLKHLLGLSACLALTLSLSAQAQEANLRKILAERLPALAKIDEINKSAT